MMAVIKKKNLNLKDMQEEIYELVGDQCIALIMQRDADGLSGVRIRVFEEVKMIRLQL